MVTVKEIEADDLPALSELYTELINKTTDISKQAVYEQIKSNNHYILLGAFMNGELMGSVMGILCHDLVGECKPFMVIENVVVSSKARRQGVGQKLMAAMEVIARERECWYIILVSGEQRKEAHIFYEALGYREEKVEGYRKHLTSH